MIEDRERWDARHKAALASPPGAPDEFFLEAQDIDHEADASHGVGIVECGPYAAAHRWVSRSIGITIVLLLQDSG